MDDRSVEQLAHELSEVWRMVAYREGTIADLRRERDNLVIVCADRRLELDAALAQIAALRAQPALLPWRLASEPIPVGRVLVRDAAWRFGIHEQASNGSSMASWDNRGIGPVTHWLPLSALSAPAWLDPSAAVEGEWYLGTWGVALEKVRWVKHDTHTGWERVGGERPVCTPTCILPLSALGLP